MKHHALLLLLLASVVTLSSCGSKGARKGGSKESAETTVAEETRALEGFWADFGPTTLLDDVSGAEERFKEWCELLLGADSDAQRRAVGEFVEVMVADEVCYYVWSEWARMYLYGVWSPWRNTEAFGVLLERIAEDERVPAEGKDFVPRLQGLVAHNRVGEEAEEFTMYDTEAREYTLASFRGQRVLLLIVDTTCPSCVDTMQEVEKNGTIMEAVRGGEVALVAVAINQTPESVVQFAEEKRGTLWQIYCAAGGDLERSYYDTEAAPMLLLISHDGRVEVAMTRDVARLASKIK